MNIRPVKQALDILMDITSAWEEEYPLELTYLFALICEFVSEGEIDDVKVRDPMQYLQGHWKYRDHGDLMPYVDVFHGIGKMARMTVSDALNESQTHLQTTGDNRVPGSLYRSILGEAKAHNGTAAVRKASFSRYKFMILHSRQFEV